MVTLLFPGRHHMLTKFQHDYLRDLIKNAKPKIDRIIFAVTSANHENTRRNPIPLYLRVLAIDKFACDLGCSVKICPIPDVKPTQKFAEFILKQIFYQSGELLNTKNTVLACSTPNVTKMFKKLGLKNFPAELISIKPEKYSTLRPYEVIELLVKAGKNWRLNNEWKKYAHKATQEVYFDYAIGDVIVEVFKDSLLNEDADITETRDYNTYARSMDNTTQIKFAEIKPFVSEGKIVDAGCSTGTLIRLLAKEFKESDIIGIEATRKFYEFCKMQEYDNPFVFFYRRNVVDQNFRPNSTNTFIYSSILHEVYSYLGERALLKLLKHTYLQLAHGGRIVIRDVVGPENPNLNVFMELNEKDGKPAGKITGLSTYSKFFRFAKEFVPRKIKFSEIKFGGKKYIYLKLRDAYEYMSKMTYTDNWKSELHEEFGFYSFKKWKAVLRKAGFEVIIGSHQFQNPYIIENKYKSRVTLFVKSDNKLKSIGYPPTNMVLAGEKN